MQQAILAKNESTGGTRSQPLAAIAPRKAFVINLCASTTPVALTPPDHAGLKRFTFFVSRRREEGRERFRLHMGYFDTQEEAEKLLDIVREIYPGAWAGLSPGQRLRGAAEAEVAGSAAAHAEAVSVPVTAKPAPIAAQMPAPALLEVAPAQTPALSLLPDEGRRLPVSENEAAARALTAVRTAIASLDDSGASPPIPRAIPQLKPATHAAVTAASSPTATVQLMRSTATLNPPLLAAATMTAAAGSAAAPAEQASNVKSPALSGDSASVLSEQSALKVLEGRSREVSAASVLSAGASTSATMPMPRITQAPSEGGKARHDKAYFAVQLMWSVQPIDMAQVPQLAIFSAYTVYGAEGNRDGRRWYGLRLGFFTDAVSAKQVAHYVRSEFSTVSVVPVTVRERERARLAVARPPSLSAPAKPTIVAKAAATADFKFIEDKAPLPPGNVAAVARAGGASRATRGAPGKRAKLRSAGQVQGRAKSKPMTLEETLEILGAGQLQIDTDRVSLNDSGVRHLRLEAVKAKSSRLGRLFERLAERIGT